MCFFFCIKRWICRVGCIFKVADRIWTAKVVELVWSCWITNGEFWNVKFTKPERRRIDSNCGMDGCGQSHVFL